jgi:hypothetical protein
LPQRFRLSRTRIVAVALALGCCVVTANGQSPGEAEDPTRPRLRPALPATSMQPEVPPAPRASTEPEPGTIPYASPPASGAGITGFVSLGARPQPATRGKKKTIARRKAPAAPAPVARAASPDRTAAPPRRPQAPEITGAIPTARPKRRPIEEEPYAPVGIPVGSFTVRSILDISAGYDTNALRTPAGPGSKFYVVAPQMSARSNWARHELTTDLRGSYTEYTDVIGNNRPELHANVKSRIDVTSLTKLELEGRGAVTTEPPNSPDQVASAVRPPNVYSFGTTAGIVQRFNRFELGLRGLVDRYLYESATLTDGTIVDLGYRNYVQYGARLRGSYEFVPGVRPFVEIGADTRVFDQSVDINGVLRGSDGWVARAGLAYERRGFLTGEISAGYMARRYRDPTLQDISGLVFDSSLTWNATPLTQFVLSATSSIDETYVVGASGLFRHEIRLTVLHAFRRYLVGTAGVGFSIEDYIGGGIDDHRLRLSLGALYYLNRALALRGELRHERVYSDDPSQNSAATIVLLGLRLQR